MRKGSPLASSTTGTCPITAVLAAAINKAPRVSFMSFTILFSILFFILALIVPEVLPLSLHHTKKLSPLLQLNRSRFVRLKEEPSPMNSPRKWRLDWLAELRKKASPKAGDAFTGKIFCCLYLRRRRSMRATPPRPSRAVEDGSGKAMLIALNVVESPTVPLVSTNVNAISPVPSEKILRSS